MIIQADGVPMSGGAEYQPAFLDADAARDAK